MPALPDDVRAATDRWVSDVVITQDFCPFAAGPYAGGNVLLEALPSDREEALQTVFRRAAQMHEHRLPETTLLVAASGFDDFTDFITFESIAEALVEHAFAAHFVTASFHPRYTFAGLASDSPVHEIHRAPYPVLQLLRRRSVAFAKTQHNVDQVLERNRARAERLWRAHNPS